MATRIDIELTSSREDGTWTWRAAGARQPKGDLAGSLLYAGAEVGDVCKIEADILMDGIDVLSVTPPKQKRDRMDDVLEMKTKQYSDNELVTEVRASRSKGGRDGGRKGGRDGGRKGGRGRDGGRGRSGGRDGDREKKPSAAEMRPKPKRLRPRRTHRDAVLAEVAPEHQPIAEQVMRGGIPAVRTAIEKQNAEAKAEGKPEIPVETVLAIADPLVPKLRTAEWRDRADSALSILDELDLRDLRSVVVASDAAARDGETRALAEQLKAGLNERIEKDHKQWLADIQEAMTDGRTVRGLRLSSRPVKAGAPLPPELAEKLAAAASASLNAEITQDRWATVLDAVAFSPIRSAVTPAGYPAEPNEKLLEAVRRVADRISVIAAHFGIDPAEAAKANKRRRPARKKKSGGQKIPAPDQVVPKKGSAAKDSGTEPADVKAPAPASPESASADKGVTAATAEPEAATEATPEPEATPAPEAATEAAPKPEATPEPATEAEVAAKSEAVADD